jgi:O-antigen/teichoic acid export membrane protein
MMAICVVALSNVLINVAVLAHVLRRSKTERSPALESLWRKALPLFLQNVFILVYFKIDTVMLGMMRGDHETGLYGAAYRFFEISNVVPTALLAAMSAPLARRMAAGDWKAFWKRGLALFMAAAFTGFVVLGGVMTWLLPIVAGPSYIPSQPLLRILSLTILFYFPNYFLTMTLVFLKKTVANAWVAATAMVFNVTANWFAIQRWGAAGAAWMTLVTEMLISAACLAIIYRTVRREATIGV